MQEDFGFLRRWRNFYEDAVNKVGNAVVLTFVGGIVSLIALGLNFKFGGK
jgi:hypothetical protein